MVFLFSGMQIGGQQKRGTEVEEGEANTAFDAGAVAAVTVVAFGDSR